MNLAAWSEMTRGVVEEELPLARAPQRIAFVAVETNKVRGDKVERAFERGQWPKRVDARDDARHAEQLGEFAIHVDLVEIEAKHFVTEIFADVKKVTGAAAEIEHAARGGEREVDRVRSTQIDLHPAAQVEVFGKMFAGLLDAVARPDRLELFSIDGADDRAGRELNREIVMPFDEGDVAAKARDRFAGTKFRQFMGDAHRGAGNAAMRRCQRAEGGEISRGAIQ